MSEWSLPRENLAGRVAAAIAVGEPETEGPGSRSREDLEAFRPRPHERARTRAARVRQLLRRLADLQFDSIRRDLLLLLPQVSGTLADIGCGAQPFRDLLGPDVTYIPVDIQDSERHFGYDLTEVRRFRGSTLPLADAEVSTVLCTETLEHVPDSARFLAELARALVPQGRLILTMPFAARWHYVPQDFRRYTPSALKERLEAAGFEQVQIYARGGMLAVACYKVLGLVLTLWVGYGERGKRAWVARALAVALAPLALMAALFGHVGLRRPGPVEDTLGYTVLARRR